MLAPRFWLVALLAAALGCARSASVETTPALRIGNASAAPTQQSARAREPESLSDADDDSLLDRDDFCPYEAEDADECNDEDGCPDSDNDDDGVADASDACPNTSGVAQNRGCPLPPAPGRHVVIEEADGGPCGLVVMEPIEFSPNESALRPDAADILEHIAYVMKHCPQLLVLAIRGLSSTHESPGLAERRAEAVRSDLIERGVPERRLRVIADRVPRGAAEREHQAEFIVARHMTCATN